jgi:hypothetical protein
LLVDQPKALRRDCCPEFAKILRAGPHVLASGEDLIRCAGIAKVPLLVLHHVLHSLDKPIEMAHTIQKIALDVVVAGFCPRCDADAEIAILPDETAGPLGSYRHVGSMEIPQDSSLVVKLFAEVSPCLLVGLLSLGKQDELPHHENPLIAMRDDLRCWRMDKRSVFGA